MTMIKKNSIVLISKDALGKFYLPIYGNKYWKTPNIDALAKKGTIFMRHYTAAPSSAMSYFSMFTGMFAHESKRKDYLPIKNKEPYVSAFDKIHDLGYECYIIWDEVWMKTAKLYSECYGKYVHFNPLEGIRQPVGAHQQHSEIILPDENRVQETVLRIEKEISNILTSEDKIFLWIHLPHVIYGRNGYGTDIDVFDRIVGILRKYFLDENIYITSDHGNMNGTHDKIGYGFDVYEAASSIPLITPRINGWEFVDFPTTNCDLFDIIFKQVIPNRNFIYSDTAYYCQLNRKLAIIHGRYKYIYNKKTKVEELYDIVYDPNENVNLIVEKKYDIDRHLYCPMRELYFYDSWEEIPVVREMMRDELKKIWKNGDLADDIHMYYIYYGKLIKRLFNVYFKSKFVKK